MHLICKTWWWLSERNIRARLGRNWERLLQKMKQLLALDKSHLSAGPSLSVVASVHMEHCHFKNLFTGVVSVWANYFL